MAYTPTTWESGDVISSAKLNKIEQGVAGAGGVFIVECTLDEGRTTCTTAVTAETIFNAVQSGKMVIYYFPESDIGYGTMYVPMQYLKKKQAGASGAEYTTCVETPSWISSVNINESGYFVFNLSIPD